LSGSTITLTGTPTTVGTFSFTLSLHDSLGGVGNQSYSFTVDPATTLAWTGLGANDDWSTGGNWSGAAPMAGDTLIFGAGARQQANDNNLATNIKLASLVFQNSGYSITGSAIELSGGLDATNAVVGTDAIALSIALTASQTTLTVDGSSDVLQLSGVLSGAISVTKGGTGTLEYSGSTANSYSGTTTVSSGTLELDKTPAAGVHAIAGALTIDAGATAQYEVSDQIAAAKTVTVEGTLDLNNNSDTISTLVLAGGTVETEGGTLTLGGNVTFDTTSSKASINGNLSLDGTTRTVTVDSGTGTDTIGAVISNGSLTKKGSLSKAGTGTLVLSGDNTYTGLTTVSAGTLEVQTTTALGTQGTTVASGATLELNNVSITGETLTLSGGTFANGSGTNVWDGNIALSASSTVNVTADQLTVDGVISGAGLGITENSGVGDTGTLVYSGTAANTDTGATTVDAGTLELDKTTANTNAIAGALTIKAGADVDYLSSNQIADTAQVTVSGTLNLAGNSDKIGSLVVTGGTVTTGTGTLTVGGSLTLTGGSITGNLTLGGNITTDASSTSATINGTLNLGSVTRTLTVAKGTTTSGQDLVINSNITQTGVSLVGLTKAGTGTLLVNGTTSYTGATTVSAGTLGGTGTIAGAVSVKSGATLAPGTSTAIGTLSTGSVTFVAGSTFAVLANSSGYAQLDVTGSLALANATLKLIVNPLSLPPTVQFAIMEYSVGLTGTFNGIPAGHSFVQSSETFELVSYTTGKQVLLELTS
jgi:autotransporter-associated beta strand protein